VEKIISLAFYLISLMRRLNAQLKNSPKSDAKTADLNEFYA
jgi:hypothetical protein